VAVIRRLIDPGARKRMDLPVVPNPSPTPIPVAELNRPEKKDLGNGVVEVEGIRFDPSKDVVDDYGAIGILKAEEFVGVALEYLKFYEHEGKARVRGYIPELPEGYEWSYAIHCNLDGPDDRGLNSGTISTWSDAQPGNKLPQPGRTFDIPLYTSKDKITSIYFNFEIETQQGNSSGNFYVSLTLKKYSRYDDFGRHSLVEVLDPRGFVEW
jgi:hypothetical protein